ncbi:MAG: alcohol dehydrogenase AdhP [Micrococcaceae bacterium]
MEKTMKAAVVTGFKKPLEVKEIDIPKPGPNDVLVKLHVTGVCHTDLHAAHGDWPVQPELPRVPGHEGIGEVIEVGDEIHHIEKGDMVGIPWLHTTCGYCEYCLTGRETLCESQKNSGYAVDGSFGEYAIMDGRYTVKCPEGIDLVKAAPLYCAGVTTYKALKVSNVKPGQWVSIVGVGGLGHIAIQYAKAMGMKVVAVERENSGLEKLAKKCGADLFYDGPAEKTGEWIKEHTDGGVHGAVVTAVAKAPFSEALNSIRRGGRVVPVGLPPAMMEVSIFNLVLGGLELVGSIVGTREDLIECLQIAEDFNIEPVTTTAKLDDINDIFEKMEKGELNGRMVIDYR